MNCKRFLASVLSVLLVSGNLQSPLTAAEIPVREALPVAVSATASASARSDQKMDGAEQQEVLSRIIPIVRAKLQVPEQLSEFNSSMYAKELSQATFSLQWSLPNSSAAQETMQVSCDASGRILSYNYYRYDYTVNRDYLPRLPKVSQEEAANLAAKLVARLCPDLLEQLAATPRLTGTNYNGSMDFFFERQIDGIPVLGQGISVYFDSEIGAVTSLYRNWNDFVGQVQSAEELITVDQAKEFFKENIGLELIYTSTSTSPEQKYIAIPSYSTLSQPYLVYRVPQTVYTALDATSGQPVAYNGGYMGLGVTYDSGYGGMVRSFVTKEEAALLPGEQLTVDQIKDLLSGEQLQTILAEFVELDLAKAKLSNLNYRKNDDGRYVANLNWRIEPDLQGMGMSEAEAKMLVDYGYGTSINAEFDAKSGDLLYYNNWDYNPMSLRNDEPQECLSDAELQAAAERFLQRAKPAQLAQSRFSGLSELSDVRPLRTVYQGETVGFSWIRQANGLDYNQNSLYVSVEPLTGRIASFNQTWHEVEFPAVEGILSEAEAEDIFAEAIAPQLVYMLENKAFGETCDASLIYTNQLYSQVMLEAKQGTLLIAGSGLPHRDVGQPYYSDMEGHAAQQKVEMLATLGIMRSDDGAFNPTAAVTESAFIKDLMLLTERYYYARSEEQLTSALIAQRIIDADEYRPEATINAGTALKYLLRKANHRNIAEMQGIFNVPQSISADLAGYAALASAYKLIDLQSWQAAKPLTRLDQAELFYAFLARP